MQEPASVDDRVPVDPAADDSSLPDVGAGSAVGGWDLGRGSQRTDDPLLGCLIALTRLYGRPATPAALTEGLPLSEGYLTPEVFVRAAERAGLSARRVPRKLGDLNLHVLPAVLLLEGREALVLSDWDGDTAVLIDPLSGTGELRLPREQLQARYTGHVLFARPNHRFDARSAAGERPRPRHWFWGTLWLSWPIYGEVLIASFLVNLFALASPLFIMNVYDRVVPNRAIETLWVLAVGVAIVFLFDLMMRGLRAYFLDVAGRKFDLVVSSRLFEQVLGLKMSSRPQSVGAFASNLHEFDGFREFFTSATLTTLIDLPFVALFLLVIWLIGGPVVLVPLVMIPLVVLYGLAVQGPLGRTVQQSFRHSAEKNATLVEALTGLETLKTMGATGTTQTRWERSVAQLARLGMRSRMLSASVLNVAAFCTQISTVGVVVYGVYLISAGELSMGGLIACTILSGRALAPLTGVAAILVRYDQAVASMRALDSVMHLPVERPADRQFVHRPQIDGAIEFDGVSFTYPGQSAGALRDVSFRIAAGEKVGIIGRVGSGKSTLSKLILGLYEPTEGAVLLDGTDLRQLDPGDVRASVGYVPQDVTLFFGTVRENITLGAPHADEETVLAAAELGGVRDFADRHPQGLDMRVGERGEGLSGGQRQGIAIARSLLMKPPVLLFDEPTNHLDNSSEERFRERLKNILPQRTLLLITHRASLLTLVDRLIVIEGGRVIADGPKERVLEALSQGQLRTGR